MCIGSLVPVKFFNRTGERKDIRPFKVQYSPHQDQSNVYSSRVLQSLGDFPAAEVDAVHAGCRDSGVQPRAPRGAQWRPSPGSWSPVPTRPRGKSTPDKLLSELFLALSWHNQITFISIAWDLLKYF